MDAKVEVTQEHWKEARKLFPHDEALAELHAVRIAMFEATRHLSVREAMAEYTKGGVNKDAA